MTMYDLKRLNEMFHEFFDPKLGELVCDIEITEDLFGRGRSIHIPFGFMKYSLILEDEKPVLKVRVLTRMDMDMLYLISEDEIRKRDLFRF